MIYWNGLISILTWHKSTDLFLWSLRKRLVRHVCIHWEQRLISGSGFQGVFCREVFISVFGQSYSPLLGSAKICMGHCLPTWADCVNRNTNHNFSTELKGIGVFWWKTLRYGPWGRLNNFLRFRHMMKCEFQIQSKLPFARCQLLSKSTLMNTTVKSSNCNINEKVVSHHANSPFDDFCSLSWA